jgi:hypothetical protein
VIDELMDHAGGRRDQHAGRLTPRNVVNDFAVSRSGEFVMELRRR